MAVTPIDEHKYSKRKCLEWSVQAALSYANGTLIHILMPIYKLSNSNQTQGQFSWRWQELFHSVKDSLNFTHLLHFVLESISRGWNVWKAHLQWPALTLFSIHSARYNTRRMKNTHTSVPYSSRSLTCKFYTFASQRRFSAQTTLSFCAAQAGSRARTHLSI